MTYVDIQVVRRRRASRQNTFKVVILVTNINLSMFFNFFDLHYLSLIEIVLMFFRGGKYSEEDAKAVMVQILTVVAFCHLQGVVHRDLKPEVNHILKTFEVNFIDNGMECL